MVAVAEVVVEGVVVAAEVVLEEEGHMQVERYVDVSPPVKDVHAE